MNETILVTGAAGFIGFHISKRLLEMGYRVVGVDNINPYYDVRLKEARLEILRSRQNFIFYKMDISDYKGMEDIFRSHRMDRVCNLAAQAGVRHSLKDPFSYERSNIQGFLNVLELCRRFQVSHLVYASSSSVYGANRKVPFSEDDRVDSPLSLYGATKKANEVMAHAYHYLYGISCIGLRYFTVYGPWGRPDMALFLFTDAIINERPIKVFNYGDMKRDFTYIDDAIEGTVSAIRMDDMVNEIFNIGNSESVDLLRFISIIEKELGMEAKKELLPMQPGDVKETFADIKKAKELLGFYPKIQIEEGIKKFIRWYKEFYNI